MKHPHFPDPTTMRNEGHSLQLYVSLPKYYALHKLFPRRGHLQTLLAHTYELLHNVCINLQLKEFDPENERLILAELKRISPRLSAESLVPDRSPLLGTPDLRPARTPGGQNVPNPAPSPRKRASGTPRVPAKAGNIAPEGVK